MTNLTETHRLAAPASATILAASAFASDLIDSCETHQHILLDVTAVAQADISFVQLVHAAQQHLIARGGSLYLTQPISQILSDLLHASGVSSEDTAADFWFKGASSQ